MSDKNIKYMISKSKLLVKWSEVAQSCPTLCDPVDCSPPGSSICGIHCFLPKINGNLSFWLLQPQIFLSFLTPLFVLHPVQSICNPDDFAFKHVENLTTYHFYTVITLIWRYVLTSLPASFSQIVLSIVAEGILLKTCPSRIKILIWSKCRRPDCELQSPVLSAPSNSVSRSHLLSLFPFPLNFRHISSHLRTFILAIDSPLSAFPLDICLSNSLTAAAAAKSLQSCPTLCDPIDGSPPGSPIPGILQARILEWVAISSSNAWKWKVKVKSLSHVRLLATPWTAAYQAPPSMGFSRQEYCSGVPLPSLSNDSNVAFSHVFSAYLTNTLGWLTSMSNVLHWTWGPP